MAAVAADALVILLLARSAPVADAKIEKDRSDINAQKQASGGSVVTIPAATRPI